MINIFKYKEATWTDLHSPTSEEIKEVSDRYRIAKDVADDISSPSERHTVNFGEDHAYIVLHFAALDESPDDAAYELDFIVGKDFVVTVHYQDIEAITKFKSEIEAPILSETPTNPRDAIFFSILQTMITSFNAKLSKIDHWVREIERNMFEGKEKKTIFELSEASRHLIDFKKITAVYPDALKELSERGKPLFGDDFARFTHEVLEYFEKTRAKLELLSVSVHELRETNSSIVSTRQNETMKVLTAVTVFATVIVGTALIWLGYLALK